MCSEDEQRPGQAVVVMCDLRRMPEKHIVLKLFVYTMIPEIRPYWMLNKERLYLSTEHVTRKHGSWLEVDSYLIPVACYFIQLLSGGRRHQ